MENLFVFDNVVVSCRDYEECYEFEFRIGEFRFSRFLSKFGIDGMSGRDMLVWLESYVEMCKERYNDYCIVNFGEDSDGNVVDKECREMKWRFEGKLDKEDL